MLATKEYIAFYQINYLTNSSFCSFYLAVNILKCCNKFFYMPILLKKKKKDHYSAYDCKYEKDLILNYAISRQIFRERE